MTMNDMSEKLPSKDFIRVHRSYILPFNRIVSVRSNAVSLPEREIPVGKTYIKDFNGRYGK